MEATAAGRPEFDAAVPRSGYRWWYVDGISDDGRNAVVVIAFVGSVFSPYYFRARSRGPADPTDSIEPVSRANMGEVPPIRPTSVPSTSGFIAGAANAGR